MDSTQLNFPGEAMKKKSLIPIIICFVSCATFNKIDPYPGMETIRYDDETVYVFDNRTSDTLVVFFDGSGWTSVLGKKGENKWESVRFGLPLVDALKEKYIILLPEKLNWEAGKDYTNKIEERKNYTIDNILTGYINAVNSYIQKHRFEKIVLIGFSEGAMILPLIYTKINHSEKISGMVSIAFGGLSIYESYDILSKSPLVPNQYQDAYRQIVDAYTREDQISQNADEIALSNMTYRYFNSIIKIRPYNYFTDIDIPVLFIHGKKDINIPVESTLHIQENLEHKPYTYIFPDTVLLMLNLPFFGQAYKV